LQIVKDASLVDTLDNFADIQPKANIDCTFPVIVAQGGVVVIVATRIVAKMQFEVTERRIS
jgi:hypothetical protein